MTGAAVRFGSVPLAVAFGVALACGAPPPEPDPEPVPEAVGPAPAAAADEPARIGACRLLAIDELAEALGETVVDGVEEGPRCTWGRSPNEAGYSEPAVTVRLEFSPADPLTLLATYEATLRSAFGEYESVPVERVGDAASWDGSAMVATVAVDAAGSAFVSVQLHDTGFEPDAERDVVLGLLRQAVSRIASGSPPTGRRGGG